MCIHGFGKYGEYTWKFTQVMDILELSQYSMGLMLIPSIHLFYCAIFVPIASFYLSHKCPDPPLLKQPLAKSGYLLYCIAGCSYWKRPLTCELYQALKAKILVQTIFGLVASILATQILSIRLAQSEIGHIDTI